MKDLGLVKYDAMIHAIQLCEEIDEVKDIRDKARALELYAQQAMNTDAERKACGVRLRAEKECGKRSAAMNKSSGTRTDLSTTGGEVDTKESQLKRAGISTQQASKWERLAQVPDDEFERALADPDKKPSTASLIRKVNGSTDRMDADTLWIWGRLGDLERRNIFERNTEELVGELTPAMVDDLTRILPNTIDWLKSLENICHE